MDRTFLGGAMWTYRVILAVTMCLATACKNPDYCAGNPNSDCRLTWDAPDPKSCKGDGDCMAPTAVCDLGATMTCVQCTTSEPGACSGATPACVNTQCQKCTMHAQCTTSNVCLPDGSCADMAQVAYVAMGGSGSACSKSNPCGTLNDGLSTPRPYVKVTGTVTDTKATTIDGKAVTILADPGAQLSRSNPGVILQVQNDGADVRIFDLEITGGIGAGNAAVSLPNGGAPKLTLTRVKVDGNAGIGVLASSGTLTMSRSIVSNNNGGGVSISGAQFDITNCFIVENGGTASALGGVDISQIVTPTGTHRLDFNTIAANLGPATVVVNTGVNCTTIGTTLMFDSNIIYGNAVNAGGKQLGGSPMCTATYSDVGPDPAAGATNINVLPMFNALAQGDFHLASTSPCKDAADPAATIPDDIDGDTRPQGPRRDMGADEIKQ